MRDYKYKALTDAPLPEWGYKMKDFRTETLIPVAESFQWNLIRSSTFAAFPAWIALEVAREQLWLDYAHAKFGYQINPNLSEFERSTTSDKVADEFNRLVKEYRELPAEQLRKQFDSIGVDYVEYRLRIREQQVAALSIEAVLSTIVIDSWSAFESLVSDLWITAVDKGPREIRLRVANSNKLLRPDDNISAKQLFEAEYDPSTNFGSSLRELGRVSFQKLDYIQRFYTIAFDYEFKKLFAEVESGYIGALSAFRNALIHNSGKADKQFVRQVAQFPEFQAIKPKDILLLDGELVKRLRDAGRLLGQRMIQFVDAVLTPPNDVVSDS